MANCRDLDELVTPYVDGEASPSEHALVDAHLTACPPCRTRAEAESTAREVLRARAPELVRGCAPGDLRARCAQAAREGRATSGATAGWKARSLPFAIAASVVLVIGLTFVGLSTRSTTVMAAQLTLDHVKCWETVDESSRVDPSQLEARMEQRFGWHVRVPPGSDAEGLRLVTARRCRYSDGSVAHIMYRHLGRPVSLFMLPDKTIPPKELVVMGHETVMWSADGRTYLLVAREPRIELEHVATYVRTSTH